MAESAPFQWGSGGERISADSIKRRRQVAAALLKGGMDYSPVGHWTQGLARVAQALVGGYEEGKLDAAEKVNTAEDAKTSSALVAQLLGGGTQAPVAAPASPSAAPSMAGGGATRAMAMPNVAPDLKDGIAQTASALGISPVDLATAISYETAGTFDPTKAGPRTQWGQHRGLIQFGEPQAREHGVDWNNPVASQLGPNGAVASYLKAAGVKPGMGMMDIYSAINAGGVGRYGASDANNGGAPGTVADKVNNQMAGHRAKALALFGNPNAPAPGASPVSMESGQPGFFVPPGPQPSMSGQQFNAIHGNDIVPPVFQSEGIGQPWMGTALPPEAPAGPTMMAAPLPPARPTDLAMPQADMPAPGAVPAIGQLPPLPQEDLSNAPGAGAREGIVRALMAQQGQSAGAPPGMAIPPAGATPAPASAPAAQQVAQALAQPAPAQSSDNALASALMSQNPALQRVAQAVLTNRIEGSRGVVMGDRLINPRTGAVIADYSQMNGGRSNEFSLNPIYGVDKDGNPVVMQLGKRGDAAATKLPEGVKLARDPIKVDGPTGTTLLDPQTRQQIGFIPKDNAKAEADKVIGKAQGESSAGMADAIAKSEQTLSAIAGIRNHPGRSSWGAQGSTAAWPIIGNGLPGTEGRDFVARVDQLKGQSFLEAFNMLKGGGAISETEGRTATDAIARLDRAQSKEGFDAALSDLEKVIRSGMERARQKAGGSTPARASSDGWSEVAPDVRIREKR